MGEVYWYGRGNGPILPSVDVAWDHSPERNWLVKHLESRMLFRSDGEMAPSYENGLGRL